MCTKTRIGSDALEPGETEEERLRYAARYVYPVTGVSRLVHRP